MSNLKEFLAAKYMSGPKADAILARAQGTEKKKKKRKTAAPASSQVRDEDGGWADDAVEEEIPSEALVENDRSFKKRKVGEGWETVRQGEAKPVVKEAPKPEEMETVYRDSSGRRIDTKAERAAAARLKREREEKEAQRMEWGKGLVQREDEERRKREEEKERTRGLARYADDKELNEEQRAQERWNDPAAAFLTKKTSKGPRKPTYNGPPPPPNRFGIKPGYRWDGVDRGNGFEKKMFQRANDRKRKGLESYQWSVDEM